LAFFAAFRRSSRRSDKIAQVVRTMMLRTRNGKESCPTIEDMAKGPD